ncbi:hypothetical protein AMK09_21495 [Streptomyces sp. CB02488]|nr:hypothetical protein AMK09_21495 [Streptomyces sp. CB02488]
MIPIQWREAEEGHDAKLFADFKCALTVPPSTKPPVYERQVQRFFREQVWEQLGSHAERDPRLRIAEDAEGIAAAYVHLRYDSDHPMYMSVPGYGSRLIGFMGIATRYRRQGGGFADQVLTDALYEARDADGAILGVVVWGKVHRRNKPCKSMLTRNDFRYRSLMEDDGPLEHWAVQIDR